MDLVDWLEALDPDALEFVLAHRPDVLRHSAPRDLDDLARRLVDPGSIASALLDQPLPAVQVMGAVMTWGASTVARVAGLLRTAPIVDGSDHLTQVQGWLGQLASYALVWGDGETVTCARELRHALTPPADVGVPIALALEASSLAGLKPVLKAWGLPSATSKHGAVDALTRAFGDPARVAEQLRRLDGRSRTSLVDQLRSGGQTGSRWDPRTYNQQAEARHEALALGLVLPGYEWTGVMVPAEVAVALLDLQLPFDTTVPLLTPLPVAPEMVERESQAALSSFSDAALAVADHVRARPVATLKSGGVGAREVSRLAKSTSLDVPTLRLLVELLCAAEILEEGPRGLEWSEIAAAWRDSDPGARVMLLIERWPVLGSHPTVTHDESGAIPLAHPGRWCVLCVEGRTTVLGELSLMPAGTGVGEAQLGERARWARPFAHLTHRRRPADPEEGYADTYGYRRRSPRRWEDDDRLPLQPLTDQHAQGCGAVLAEAALLGLVAHGTATPLLTALTGSDREAAVAVADRLLPKPVAAAAFGSDLTVVVTGPPTGQLTALLDACADRESRGGAVTWRVSPSSVRRALDAGETADGLRRRLAAVATSGLPQPLDYLLTDVGRRHGSLRVGPARSLLTGVDEAVLAQVVTDRKLSRLRLRLVAPTVASAQVDDDELLLALRGAGYLPMPVDPPEPTAASAPRAGSARRTSRGRGREEDDDSGWVDLPHDLAEPDYDDGDDGSADRDAYLAEVVAWMEQSGLGMDRPRTPLEPESPRDAAARLTGRPPRTDEDGRS